MSPYFNEVANEKIVELRCVKDRVECRIEEHFCGPRIKSGFPDLGGLVLEFIQLLEELGGFVEDMIQLDSEHDPDFLIPEELCGDEVWLHYDGIHSNELCWIIELTEREIDGRKVLNPIISDVVVQLSSQSPGDEN